MSSLSSEKPKAAGNAGTLTLDEVKTLGTELLSSREHINNLPHLLRLLSPPYSPDLLLESLLSLHSFFLTLLPDIPSRSRSKPSAADKPKDPEELYKQWLRARFDEFLDSLVTITTSPEFDEAITDVVLEVIMEFVKKGKGGAFESAIYFRLINGLVRAASVTDTLLNLLVEKFFKYADIRYHTYISLAKIAKKCEREDKLDETKAKVQDESMENNCILEASVEASIHSMFIILSRISSLETFDEETIYEMWSNPALVFKGGAKDLDMPLIDGKPQHSKKFHFNVLKKLKVKFTKAWRLFLKLRLTMDVYKEVLGNLHQVVIPKVTNPVFLCDFLTRSYDIGGVISVMALSGLYILITQHGIEYPNYYTKLYALLTPGVFMAKYRSRFFQLLDTSLQSGYVPAYLAAAFAKKLSRLALTASPSGALVIIAIIHNLLRRHPAINFLVHQIPGGGSEGEVSDEGNISTDGVAETNSGPVPPSKTNGIDPFKMDESDPVKSNAMRSSLWEIETLRRHYFPDVSRFVTSLESDLTIRNKTSEVAVSDFASGSYATNFGSEIRRRMKLVPLAFYRAAPTSLFSESEFAGWTFQGQECGTEVGAEKEASDIAKALEKRDSKRQKIDCF